MGNRRGWQIAGVAGLWLSYGGFMLWPTLLSHFGNRAYTLPLVLLAVVLGWVTVAAWRAIAAHRLQLTHWETRLPLTSLLAMLLAVDFFTLDILTAVAMGRSFADAPFAQAGWVAIVFFGAAVLLAVVGGLGHAALRTPMPAPGGYRDAPTARTAPPIKSTIFQQKTQNLTHEEATRQLQAIGIALLAFLLFLTPLPPWIAGFVSNVSLSWIVWHNVALYPLRRLQPSRYNGLYHLGFSSMILGFVLVSSLFFANLPTAHLTWVFGNIGFIFYEMVALNLLLDMSDVFHFASKGLPSQASSPFSFILIYIYSLGTALRFSSNALPQPIDILQAGAFFIFLAFLLGLHTVASIRALRPPAPSQPEVAA